MRNTCWAIVLGLAVGACIAPEAESEESEAETVQAVGSGPPEPPEPDEPVCEDTPGCSLTFLGGYMHSLQSQLGCTQTYTYWSGASAGFLGGKGSFCPNTIAVRNALRAAGVRGYLPGYCNDCLDIKSWQVFAFWTTYSGPDCPSSCAPGTPPRRL